MAEYLRIINDDGVVFIDDSFQNYHFLEKKVIQGSTLPHYSTGRGGIQLEDSNGFLMVQYSFNVYSTKKPLVAYQVGTAEDACITAITYTETSTNNWTIKVMFPSQYRGVPGTYGNATLYVYGLIPLGTAPSTGAVFQVRNSSGEIIFDSGRKPMTVVQFDSKLIPYSWNSPNSTTAMRFFLPIKNYSAGKKYAIIPGSFMFDSVYSNPNFYYYSSSAAKVFASNPSQVELFKYQSGINNIMTNQNYPSMVSYSHAHMLIDVTGL